MTVDGYIAHNTITTGQYGIVTFEAYNDAIRYNTISYNTEYGAKDYNSQLKNCFNWNYFHNNKIAYYYDPDTALDPIEFDGNILEDNYIAIMVENASTITITNNTLTRNDYGIYLINASPNIAFNTISNAYYGIYTEHSSSLISNNTIKEIAEYGIHAQFGDSLNITNNSVIDTPMIFFDSVIEELWLIDSTVIVVNTIIEESHLDATSGIEVRWSLQIEVLDDEGNPMEGAAVLVYDGFDSLVSTQVTDSDGLTEIVLVIDTFEDYLSTITYNPYQINVTKGSLENTSTITIDHDTVLTITLQDKGSVIKPAGSVFPWALVFLIGFIAAMGISGLAIEIFKYGLISLFLPLYSRIKKEELLDQPIRYKIHGYLIGKPGAHFGLIKQDLHIPNGQLVYHLKKLMKADLIYSREDGIKKRFYPKEFPKLANDQQYIGTEEMILGVLKNNSGANQKEIASSLGVSRQVVGYHLNKMEEKGVVRKELKGRIIRYFPLESSDA
jgi:parallel beta-helix repeat protein